MKQIAFFLGVSYQDPNGKERIGFVYSKNSTVDFKKHRNKISVYVLARTIAETGHYPAVGKAIQKICEDDEKSVASILLSDYSYKEELDSSDIEWISGI